ncbi:MAG: Peptidoglycan glycosyltransferase, partial [Verrucomicrobiales bacterium]|nr:Peptidoglycan glycosyltransferase [Verrucomicrobiales bacterium]
MGKSSQTSKLTVVCFVVVLGLVGLGCKLVELQVFRHEELSAKAVKNTQSVIARAPLRGQIKDARGNPLALSVPAKIVCADPTLVGPYRVPVANALAPLLDMEPAKLVELLTPKTRETEGKLRTNSFVLLKRKVSLERWAQIEKTMTNVSLGIDETKLKRSERNVVIAARTKGIFTQEDQIRTYPNQELAAHVLGYMSREEKPTGLMGIEKVFDSKLGGFNGWKKTETDIRKREMVAFRDQDVEAQDGLNVILTLDAGLQHIVESELAEGLKKHTPVSVSATIIRPRTGEVLAMASLPDFDPNDPGKYPQEYLRNRIISDVQEPGSTFKIVVVSAALNENLIQLTDIFDCRNNFYYGGRTLHDHESYGDLSVESIITKSSNIGAAKVGIKLGESKLDQYIRSFGFGMRSGLPLNAEESGIVHPLKNWSKVSIAQIPMGQGLAVTHMQMVMAMNAIANEGRLMRPYLVSRLEDEQGVVAEYKPQMIRQVVSPEAAHLMVQALKTVVGTNGTAVEARMKYFTVAGKTGTAQKVENGHYSKTKFFSSFIGFFPADNPELLISVVMDEPKNGHYGGKTAGPVFKAIAERAVNYLNIRPDIQPETNGV